MKAVVMPALGVAMSEGLLLRWIRSAGDTVAAGEPIIEIETDKATVEVESPAAGVLGPLLFAPGAIVPVGVAMVMVQEEGDDVAAAAQPPQAAAPIDPVPVVAPGPRQPGDIDEQAVRPAAGGSTVPPRRAPNALSPRERMLARERAAALAAGATDRPVPAAADEVRPEPAATGGGAPGRHRELIAAKVSESWRTIPHFAVTRAVDATAMIALRGRWIDGPDRPSLTDLMLRALALALHDGGEPGPVDVGLAVATPDGVAIPVIRGVLGLDLAGLRREREAAVARARGGRLRPSDLSEPPRSTLSNLGPQGIDSFTGVIANGQMSLLTVGRVAPRPWVADGGGLTVRESFFATLNVDHRHLDGDDAARLLIAFVSALEDGQRLEREVVLA